jgi:CheY-like chemotaxis protein
MDIILFDDDMIYLEVTSYRLGKELEGVKIECAKNLNEFLQLENVQHKILVLDLNMPEASGWEIIDELVALGKLPAKVLLCSSSIDPTDKARASAHPHVTCYLEKPLNPALLRSATEDAA